MVKTDANGQHEWNTTFGGTDYDIAYSLLQTSDGGFALTGDTRSYGAGGSDMWLVKTDANGQHEWNTTFGGADYDRAYSSIQTSDGDFALAGSTGLAGVSGKDFWLVKTEFFLSSPKSTPSWTPIIVIMSLIVIMVRKRMKRT